MDGDRMTPYRRPVLHPNHGCIAITVKGRRCCRPHASEQPITFEWDPVTGRGIGGPNVTLCRMHNYLWELDAADRIEIVGGWMGRAWNPDAECWTVCITVYDAKDGLFASPHWWALRRDLVFGDCSKIVYDDAFEAKFKEAG
jgi:hypothetical protein